MARRLRGRGAVGGADPGEFTARYGGHGDSRLLHPEGRHRDDDPGLRQPRRGRHRRRRELQRASRPLSPPGLWQRPASLRGRAPVAANCRRHPAADAVRALSQHDLAGPRERALARIRVPWPPQSAASTAIGSARSRSVYLVSPSDDTEFLDACERTLIGLSEPRTGNEDATLKPSLSTCKTEREGRE